LRGENLAKAASRWRLLRPVAGANAEFRLAVCFNSPVLLPVDYRAKLKRVPAIAAVLLAAALPAMAQQPVGELYASDASVRGSMMMTASGTQVMSGSQVSAGANAAVLRLTRGGEVRICPRTSLAVSEASASAPMLFGINAGSMEINYTVAAVADSLVTPDFRLQFAGPGTFHVAVGADSKGNTCVRTLDGNTAGVIVFEMLGSGTYQVAPGTEVLFREGKLENAEVSTESCGCPAPKPIAVAPPKDLPATTAKTAPEKPAVAKPAAQTPTAVEMESPLVFKGKSNEDGELRREQYIIATLRSVPVKIDKALVPSTRLASKPKQQKGFFGKIGSFFARVFK
jgi:hypothetical protein